MSDLDEAYDALAAIGVERLEMYANGHEGDLR